MTVALLYGQNVFATGVKRYADLLPERLRQLGVEAEVVNLKRRELRLGRLHAGGFVSLWLERIAARRGPFELVHALDPAVATRHSDVVTIHDLVTEAYPEWYQHTGPARIDWIMVRALARRVPWLIADSEVTRGELISRWGIDPERVTTIHLGIDQEHFHPVPGGSKLLAPDRPNLVYVGDDNPRKNLGLAVRAVAALRTRHGIDARLLRIGPTRFPASHEAYRAFAREHSVDLVEPGFVDDDELVALLSAASLFLWPTLAEGFGFPPLEAMACGAPVVALDTPINREICGPVSRYHGNTPEAAADAIAASLAAPPARDAVLAHARAFSWDRCARETVRVYERATEYRAARRGA